MTGPSGDQDNASTPLSEEEREGLLPSYITLRGELNEAEQANILEAEQWASLHCSPAGSGQAQSWSVPGIRAFLMN